MSNKIAYSLHNAGFIDSSDIAKSLITDDTLIFMYRSAYCWAFARITNVVINARHELILIRAHNGNNYNT